MSGTPQVHEGDVVSRGFGRSGTRWLSVGLSASVLITGAAVVAGAAVVGKHHDNGGRSPVICRSDGRLTVESHGVYYIVRNDVFTPERQCIQIQKNGAGFVVVKTQANSRGGGNDAFPEVLYGCAWGLCTKYTVLPKRVYRLKSLVTSWSAIWRRAPGMFSVAYDIWFGHLHTIHGHARAAELMIWLGNKHFPKLLGNRIYRIDGARWYYARHYTCDVYGCWNYIRFSRVVPTSRAQNLNILPFMHVAEKRRQLAWWWFLKSIDVGFEIWNGGKGLAARSYSVKIKLYPLPRSK
jgi:hypothetical protein